MVSYTNIKYEATGRQFLWYFALLSSEISDERSSVSEFIVADNVVKVTTETSVKKFQDRKYVSKRKSYNLANKSKDYHRIFLLF